MNTAKRYTGIEETTETIRPTMNNRNPILSLSQLSEQHYELAVSKLNTLHTTTNETRTEATDDLDIAEMISKQIGQLDEIRLHLETSRTLFLTKTITDCPNCGYDLTRARR